MWSRWTLKAREAVYRASDSAKQRGQDIVDGRHYAEALLRDETNVACKALLTVGIAPEAAHLQVLRALPPVLPEGEGWVQVQTTTKPLLDAVYQEAIELNCNYIGTEHLLLGLLREPNPAKEALRAAGLEWRVVRDLVEQWLAQRSNPKADQASDPS